VSKKRALGRDPYDWIGGTETPPPETPPTHPPTPTPEPSADRETAPKYRQMLKVDALLRPEQVEALDRLVREIMSRRSDKRERITRNTLLRVAVETLLAVDFSIEEIPTEEELQQRVLAAGRAQSA